MAFWKAKFRKFGLLKTPLAFKILFGLEFKFGLNLAFLKAVWPLKICFGLLPKFGLNLAYMKEASVVPLFGAHNSR